LQQTVDAPAIIPGSEPFFYPRGATGCLLLHGFTSTPEEMRWLGQHLVGRGFTVLGARLAGHGTHPGDLARIRFRDWRISVEEGLAFLRGAADRIFVAGQSMGGLLALLAAADYPLDGAIAMSAPFYPAAERPSSLLRLLGRLRPMVRKEGVEFHPELGARREKDYPAYAVYPSRIYPQIVTLRQEMAAALPRIRVPVLLLQSRDDGLIPPDSMDRIYQALGTAQKEKLWLEGLDHGLVRDPGREVVFDAVAGFLERVVGAKDSARGHRG
jgi:carboxylesterase